MPAQKINISVADDYLDRFSEVVERVSEAGLRVEQQLEGIGIVSGTIDSDKLAVLDGVEGVAAVEASREIHIAPPDSDIQ